MWVKGKAILAGVTLVAVVFMLAVFAIPLDAQAFPPGQLKKLNAEQLEDLWHNEGKLPYGQAKKMEKIKMQHKYTMNNQFTVLRGYVYDVLGWNQNLIILAEDDDSDEPGAAIRVTGGTTILIDGRSADLDDIDDGYWVVAVVNPAGNAFIVSASSNRYSRGYINRGAPQIDELAPANGAKDVKIGLKKLVATFDERIYPLKNEKDIESAIEVRNITKNKYVTVSDIDIDGRDLEITLRSGLEKDCRYSVYIPANLFEDSDGNNFGGIANGKWVFTTAEKIDNDAPEIAKLVPEDGDKGVEIGLKTLVATFEERIYPLKDEKDIESAIKVRNITKNKYVTVSDIDIDGRDLEITLRSGLEEDCKYSIYIPDNLFEDNERNNFAGLEWGDWVFTTAKESDNDGPRVINRYPANNARLYNVSEAYIQFDENIRWTDSNAKNAVFVFNLDKNDLVEPKNMRIIDNKLEITFDGNLKKGNYGITILDGVIEDRAGNEYGGITSNQWSFEIR